MNVIQKVRHVYEAEAVDRGTFMQKQIRSGKTLEHILWQSPHEAEKPSCKAGTTQPYQKPSVGSDFL